MPIDPRGQALRRAARGRLAGYWLLAGVVLLALTPLRAWTPLLGWAPLLVLVVSPCVMLLALDPGLPLALVAGALRERRHRRARAPGLAW